MDFYALVDQVVDLVRRRGRVSYQALKSEFDLDDERLLTLKEEVLFAHRESVGEQGRGLVWIDHDGAVPPWANAPGRGWRVSR